MEEAVKTGIIAFSAAIAISVPALATALAQSRIGAAMAGAVAERPELAGTAIIMVAIPETMVILGLVIAFMITTLNTVAH
ncbi:MAG: ATPase [Actinobacteria bacterium]|nr:ATPase [Actinomycetota bacterium]MBU4302560.1 ATPase [Actinomycetota bacterium]MBU4386207.1 ATPase [Actinomycetota bacterium]MBU4489618.1 ATPase [Actinomycetota bacterium]MCG2795048.1 ATPase [Actinomycetes bacterium]